MSHWQRKAQGPVPLVLKGHGVTRLGCLSAPVERPDDLFKIKQG